MSNKDFTNPLDSTGNLTGQGAMGIVVDVKDPKELGRVKIRMIGLQSEDRVPDKDLPWIHCSMNNEPSSRGIGSGPPNYSVGSKVLMASMGQQGYVVTASLGNVDPDLAKSDVPEDIKSNTPREIFTRDGKNYPILTDLIKQTGTKAALDIINGIYQTKWNKTSDANYYKPAIDESKTPNHYKNRAKSRSKNKDSIGVEQFAGEIQNAQKYIMDKIGEKGSLMAGALSMIDNLYKVKNPLTTPHPVPTIGATNILNALSSIASFFEENKNNDKEEEELVCEGIDDLLKRKECRIRLCNIISDAGARDACILVAEEMYTREIEMAATLTSNNNVETS